MKIISGGQTGVDQAALDAAIEQGIEHGGWCPKGRLCEDPTVPSRDVEMPTRFKLQETETADYSERTKRNIQGADATLIIVPAWPLTVTDGTVLTYDEVKSKKHKVIILDDEADTNELVSDILEWINGEKIETLNVAGPRESQAPGIYENTKGLLSEVFKQLKAKPQAALKS